MSESFYSVRPFEQFVQGELDLRKKNISIESPTDNSYQIYTIHGVDSLH